MIFSYLLLFFKISVLVALLVTAENSCYWYYL